MQCKAQGGHKKETMVNNEKYLYELMQAIEKSINDIILVHGQIHKVQKFGNAVAIYFTDGNVYKQPLITKDRLATVEDSLR